LATKAGKAVTVVVLPMLNPLGSSLNRVGNSCT